MVSPVKALPLPNIATAYSASCVDVVGVIRAYVVAAKIGTVTKLDIIKVPVDSSNRNLLEEDIKPLPVLVTPSLTPSINGTLKAPVLAGLVVSIVTSPVRLPVMLPLTVMF